VAPIVEREDSYPLAPLQHGVLYHRLAWGAHTGVDVEQLDLTLRATIDAARLARAWELAAARHPVLRTRLRWEGLETPRQEVMAAVDVLFVRKDLSSLAVADRAASIARFLEEDRLRGFELDTAPLWRVTLFCLGRAGHRMVWTYSPAILDGCYAEVVREVFDAYHALSTGIAPRFAERPSYRDQIAWLHQDWASRAESARGFWRERLNGFVKPSTLDGLQLSPPGRPRAGHETLHFRLNPSTSAALRRMCTAHGLQLSSCVQAAWALVISAFSGEDDVVFGEVRACRHSSIPDAEKIVGPLLNTVPVRARVPGDRLLLALLRDLDEGQAAVHAFEHTPLIESAACADVPRGPRLFDTLVIIDETDDDTRLRSVAGLAARKVALHQRAAFPLTLKAALGPRMACRLSFDGSRFDLDFAGRVAGLMKRLLHAMAARPGATLAELPRLPARDVRAIASFNRTAVQVPAPDCVHECVEAQVDRTPDAVALVCRDQFLTYRELEERANQVAAELAARGVGPDQTVAVFVDRSLETVVGLLGILKAGGAYLPLDPSHPSERTAMMLEDSRPSVVLTVGRLRAALPPVSAQVVVLDALGCDRQSRRIRRPVRSDHLAYVIYTSGSTGRPKGVQVEHRNVINFFRGMDEVLGTTPGVWLALAGISFDISVLELFWTLSRGFTVVVQASFDRISAPPSSARSVSGRGRGAEPGAANESRDFSVPAQIRRHGVTHLQLTPSYVAQLALETEGLEAFAALQHVMVGGEALPAAMVDQLRPYVTGTFRNMYGPTETTIWSTTATVTPGQPITIGRPIANTTACIRNLASRPVPIGVAGELLIGGAGVARGYAGRPELTAQRFVHDPTTGERLYRTGDLAAWRPDGQLVFLGRIDHQVKIRGHRVELGEIDAVIGGHPSVSECITVAQHPASGDLRLVAWVVPRPADERPRGSTAGSTGEPGHLAGENGLAKALRQHAQARLPAYMVPSAIVLLETMPLTPSGKIDRRALASPDAVRSPAGGRPAPESDCERTIVAVMQALAGRNVGVNENFFDAGVHSLLLIQASLRLGERLGRPVPIVEMFRHPTARTLAAALAGADADVQALKQSQDRAQRRQDAMRRRRDGRPAY
jgi:non-ribosomal peptide synthetase component F